jgi:hypothetical protein
MGSLLREKNNSAPPPAVRGGNVQILAVFRDGAASDLNAVLAQHFADLVVCQRVRGVFLLNHLLDLAL